MLVEIIAEVAQGYEGNPALAHLLARGAARSGADAVKFQLVYADEIAARDYQYYKLFRMLEMPQQAWKKVVDETRKAGVRLYMDIFGEQSLCQAVELGVDGIKIHATDFFNNRLVRAALHAAPSVYVSLGGISVEELDEFIQLHRLTPDHKVCFLYGFQAEPTPVECNNLLRLGALKRRFPGYRFGFMDHAAGDSDDALTLALMALPFGIECIEKHIGLDRTLELEDYASASPPENFRKFVERIRHLELALGTDSLELTSKELEYRQKSIKVVVAARAIPKGTPLSPEVLSLKRVRDPRPSSLLRLEHAIGHAVTVDVALDQPITGEMLS